MMVLVMQNWDLQRMWASERAMIIRNQGFIHPATLVPEELEYNKGYEARMAKLNKKFKDIRYHYDFLKIE